MKINVLARREYKNYYSKYISYENIFQDVPKGIDFVLCMLIIYAKILGQTIHNFTFHKNIILIFIIIEVVV
jgi:hypothetical protein